MITDDQMNKAMATARSGKGAVGSQALVPRFICDIVKKGQTVLNYGCGIPFGDGVYLHSRMVMDAGGVVDEYDFNIGRLGKRYDIVMASNVLNVQDSVQMLRETLNQIHDSMKLYGIAIMNYPLKPRFLLTVKVSDVAEAIGDVFGSPPSVVGGTSAAPVWLVERGLQ